MLRNYYQSREPPGSTVTMPTGLLPRHATCTEVCLSACRSRGPAALAAYDPHGIVPRGRIRCSARKIIISGLALLSLESSTVGYCPVPDAKRRNIFLIGFSEDAITWLMCYIVVSFRCSAACSPTSRNRGQGAALSRYPTSSCYLR